jgi:hypothetical protein
MIEEDGFVFESKRERDMFMILRKVRGGGVYLEKCEPAEAAKVLRDAADEMEALATHDVQAQRC